MSRSGGWMNGLTDRQMATNLAQRTVRPNAKSSGTSSFRNNAEMVSIDNVNDVPRHIRKAGFLRYMKNASEFYDMYFLFLDCDFDFKLSHGVYAIKNGHCMRTTLLAFDDIVKKMKTDKIRTCLLIISPSYNLSILDNQKAKIFSADYSKVVNVSGPPSHPSTRALDLISKSDLSSYFQFVGYTSILSKIVTYHFPCTQTLRHKEDLPFDLSLKYCVADDESVALRDKTVYINALNGASTYDLCYKIISTKEVFEELNTAKKFLLSCTEDDMSLISEVMSQLFPTGKIIYATITECDSACSDDCDDFSDESKTDEARCLDVGSPKGSLCGQVDDAIDATNCSRSIVSETLDDSPLEGCLAEAVIKSDSLLDDVSITVEENLVPTSSDVPALTPIGEPCNDVEVKDVVKESIIDDDFKIAFEEMKKEICLLRKTVNEPKECESCFNLQEQLTSLKAECDALRSELTNLKNEREVRDECPTCASHLDVLTSLKTDQDNLGLEIDSMKESIKVKDHELNVLKDALEKSKRLSLEQNVHIEELSAQLKDTRDEIVNLTRENGNLKEEITELKRKNVMLEQKIRDYEQMEEERKKMREKEEKEEKTVEEKGKEERHAVEGGENKRDRKEEKKEGKRKKRRERINTEVIGEDEENVEQVENTNDETVKEGNGKKLKDDIGDGASLDEKGSRIDDYIRRLKESNDLVIELTNKNKMLEEKLERSLESESAVLNDLKSENDGYKDKMDKIMLVKSGEKDVLQKCNTVLDEIFDMYANVANSSDELSLVVDVSSGSRTAYDGASIFGTVSVRIDQMRDMFKQLIQAYECSSKSLHRLEGERLQQHQEYINALDKEFNDRDCDTINTLYSDDSGIAADAKFDVMQLFKRKVSAFAKKLRDTTSFEDELSKVNGDPNCMDMPKKLKEDLYRYMCTKHGVVLRNEMNYPSFKLNERLTNVLIEACDTVILKQLYWHVYSTSSNALMRSTFNDPTIYYAPVAQQPNV